MGVFFLVSLNLRSASKPISIFLLAPPTEPGFTNAVWDIYVVTNHTTNAFSYVGAQILLKTNQEWVLDPDLRTTDNDGWIVPPTRMWREETPANKFLPALPGGSSFRIFFARRDGAIEWRASLRFVDYRPPGSLPANAASRTVWEVKETMRSLRKPIDCPLPDK